MKSEEGKNVAGTVLEIFLFLMVAAAFIALVMWGMNKYNNAQDDLESTVNGVEVAKFNHYDSNEVTGSDVLVAAKTYRDQEITIFLDNGNNGTYHDVVAQPDSKMNVAAFGYNGTGLGADNAGGNLNYNPDTGRFEAAILVASPQNNTNFAPMDQKGNAFYVNQNAKYYATLVYDTDAGEVAGIYFRRVK